MVLKMKRREIKNIRGIVDNILGEDKGIVLEIPLNDLVWTIVCFYDRLYALDDEIQELCELGMFYTDLRFEKEMLASRSDELARVIGQYSDFDTQQIWNNLSEEYLGIKRV